jgi:hypothetical protein
LTPLHKHRTRLSLRDQEKDAGRRYVYIVQGVKTGLVKIGHTANIKHRFGQLQAGSPDTLRLLKVLGPIRDAHRIEQALHQAFAEQRKHGEWFVPSPTLRFTVKWAKSIPESPVRRIGPWFVQGDHSEYRQQEQELAVG